MSSTRCFSTMRAAGTMASALSRAAASFTAWSCCSAYLAAFRTSYASAKYPPATFAFTW